MNDIDRDCIDYLEKNSESFGEFGFIIESIGAESAYKLIQACSGSNVYVPLFATVYRPTRNERIIVDFNQGKKLRELSKKYGISERTIRDIVKSKKAEEL